jgi:hypothetical protein
LVSGDYVSQGLVSGNIAYNADKDGIRVECYTNSQTVTIEDNISEHNVNDGIDINNCFASQSVMVRNNFVGWNNAQGLQPKHTDHVTMIDNTVYSSGNMGVFVNGDIPEGTTGNYGTVSGANWNLVLRDNIIVGAPYGGQMTSGAFALNPSIDYDLYYDVPSGLWYIDGIGEMPLLSGLLGATGYEQHGLVADPQFTSPTTGNFTLGSTSPAIGVGDTGSNLGADPAQLTGVGPQGNYGLARVPIM